MHIPHGNLLSSLFCLISMILASNSKVTSEMALYIRFANQALDVKNEPGSQGHTNQQISRHTLSVFLTMMW